jgi:hypothetical protein
MKHLLATLLIALPVCSAACAEQLIPAGSVMQCTVSEPNVSSKTTHGAYLVGHFEDYKDPGHFVGKGWMELKFTRMVVHNDIEVPVVTRVVATPKYPVDAEGRIHGNGHPVRDIVEWSIPLLWPIDLINLPRRGPRPVLGPETQLTVKVLDDIGIPTREEADDQNGTGPALIRRQAEQGYGQGNGQGYGQGNGQGYGPAPIQQAYAPQPAQNVIVVQAPAQAAPVVVQAAAAPAPVIVQQPAAPVYYGYPPPPPRPVFTPYGYYYRPY